MGLDVCISPIKATIGSIEDYESENQYQQELIIIENLIALIQAKIKEQTGKTITWNEEEIEPDKEENIELFCERLGNYSVLHHLRRYAAFIDKTNAPPETPCELEEAANDEILLEVYDGETRTQFPHLIDHSDCDGYYIPCSFEKPLWIKPSEIGMDQDDDEMLISAGSSKKLLEELTILNNYLQIDTDEISNLEEFATRIASDKWEFVKWSWAVLYYMCVNSIKFRQPMIFC
jgi:hypothetical protein